MERELGGDCTTEMLKDSDVQPDGAELLVRTTAPTTLTGGIALA